MNQTINMTDPRTLDFRYEEAVKNLRTNLQYIGRNVKCIMITSCFPNEGKSDIIFQLTKEFGNMGKRVLLLDLDLRKSSYVSRYCKSGVKIKGISHFLTGNAEIDDIIYETNFPNMDIIFAGKTAPNPAELLEDPALGYLIRELKEDYDFILVDTPPAYSMTDAAIIAKWCDGTVLVMESGRVAYKIAQKVKNQINQADGHVLGVVLNKVDSKNTRYYSKYSYYKYDYDGYYGK